MHLVRGSLLVLVVVTFACTSTPSSGPPDQNSPSATASEQTPEPSAQIASDNSPSPTAQESAPPREEPGVVASPVPPTPRGTIAPPEPSPIPPEDAVAVKGLLIHPDRTPAKNVCIIVGPQPIRCAAISGADGQFVVQLPKQYPVTWTVRYFVNGAEIGHQSITGPFSEATVQMPAFSIP